MGIWQDLWRGRSADFDSGSAATNSIELTKRNHTVSLTKQGAATGNLRINLSWRMRTSDIGGPQRGSLLRHPFRTFKPEVVQAHTQSMVNVDLDLVLAIVQRRVVSPGLRERRARRNRVFDQQVAPLAAVHAQPHGIFPRVVLRRDRVTEIAVKVESVADFASVHQIHSEISGPPLSPYRRLEVWSDALARACFSVVERHGYRGFSTRQASEWAETVDPASTAVRSTTTWRC